jgi:hypothetical protein
MRTIARHWNGLWTACETLVRKHWAETPRQQTCRVAALSQSAEFDAQPVDLFDDFSGGFGLTESGDRNDAYHVPK